MTTATEPPRTVSNARLQSLADSLARIGRLPVESKTAKGKAAGRMIVYLTTFNLSLLAPYLRPIDAVVQPALDKYGAKDQNGRLIPSSSGEGIILKDPQMFQAETAEIMAETVTLPDLKPLTWSLIETADILPEGRDVFGLGEFLTGKPMDLSSEPEGDDDGN